MFVEVERNQENQKHRGQHKDNIRGQHNIRCKKPFKTKKENQEIKDRITKVKIYSKNYIEYESNSDRNKTLSITEYHDNIKQYSRDITNYLNKSDTWKTNLSN